MNLVFRLSVGLWLVSPTRRSFCQPAAGEIRERRESSQESNAAHEMESSVTFACVREKSAPLIESRVSFISANFSLRPRRLEKLNLNAKTN